MLPIQIFLLVFFLVAIIKVVSRYHYGEIGFRGALTWVIFWLSAAVFVILPDSSFYLARLLGVGRGADAVIYIALAGLFFLVFRLMIKIEKMNREITSIIREKALGEKKL